MLQRMIRFLPALTGVFTAGAALLALELLIDADWINAYLVPPPSAVLLSFARVIAEEHIAERFLLTSAEALGTGLLLAAVGIPLGLLLFRLPLLRRATETWVAAFASAPLVLAYPLFLVMFGRSALTIVMIGFFAGLAPVVLKTLGGSHRRPLRADRRVALVPALAGAAFLEGLAAGGGADGLRRPPARPDLRADQHHRRRVPDQFRRPGAADQ